MCSPRLVAGLAIVLMSAAQVAADSVEVKGPHICCKQCVNVAEGLLSKVAGVSDAKADAKSKTVTFTAKDAAAVTAGIKGRDRRRFWRAAKVDGKAVAVALPEVKKGDKIAAVVVKDVHVCCGAAKR